MVYAHSLLVCPHSDAFRAMLMEEFTEATSKEIVLSEYSSDVVMAMLMYCGMRAGSNLLVRGILHR